MFFNEIFSIKDVAKTAAEGEPKVANVVSLSEQILPQTSPRGQEATHREVEMVKKDWEQLKAQLTQVSSLPIQHSVKWQTYFTERRAGVTKPRQN